MDESRSSLVAVRGVDSEDDADAVVAFLHAVEEVAGTPLVDESEQVALERLKDGAARPGWTGLVATTEGEILGYAGIRRDGDGRVSDIAVDRLRPSATDALRELLAALAERAPITVWLRDAGPEDVSLATEAGFVVARRLLVLGRGVAGYEANPDPPGGVVFRSFEPGEDDAAVVALLDEAYEGTPDAGWDAETFAERRKLDWFDPADLLVASGRNGHIAGIHWTKRRGEGIGEVYNLAVGPDFQGLGLGRALLRAGLAHLRRRGCEDVILWVDEANAAAVRLYVSEGFVTRWEDVAFTLGRSA